MVSGQLSVVSQAKSEARLAAKRLRAGCDPALGGRMARHVLRDCLPPSGAVVGGFWRLTGEIDTQDLLTQLAGLGYEIALPETTAPGSSLVFRQWLPGDELVTGRFGTRHTNGVLLRPDFILVPALAFDAAGNRLGYGAGYYDRTFAELPGAFRLGCAFAAQEMPLVPTGPEDVKLHAMATEAGVRRF